VFPGCPVKPRFSFPASAPKTNGFEANPTDIHILTASAAKAIGNKGQENRGTRKQGNKESLLLRLAAQLAARVSKKGDKEEGRTPTRDA
jgi:hypothetical protein